MATMCLDCGLRKAVSGDIRLCRACEDYAGMENTHSDYGHDNILKFDATGDISVIEGMTADHLEHEQQIMVNCPVCHPELDKRPTSRRTGHTNTVAKTRTSHAGHHHARDPQDRAICRRTMAATGNPYDARKV